MQFELVAQVIDFKPNNVSKINCKKSCSFHQTIKRKKNNHMHAVTGILFI